MGRRLAATCFALSVVVAAGCSPQVGGASSPDPGGAASGGFVSAAGGASGASGMAPSGGTGNILQIPTGSGGQAPRVDGGNCGSVSIPSETKTVAGNLLVLFDQSLTMGDPWTDATGATVPKYAVAEAAVKAGVGVLANGLNVGAIFFPTTAAGLLDLCTAVVAPITSAPQIAITPGSQFLPAWDQHFAPPWTLILGTPLNRALDQALTALKTTPGTSAVVILTDGQWTCQDGTEQTNVQALFALGIKTYIVGLPGSAGTVGLDQLAAAGGTAKAGCTSNCFLLPTDGKELTDELSHIVTTTVTVSSCDLTLDPAPPDPVQVHLIANETASGSEFEVLRTDPTGDGWNLSGDAKVATLTGTVCAAAKSGGLTNLHFEYGCVKHPPLKPPR